MAKVTIGGTEYDTSPLNFKALKKVWPHVSKLTEKTGEETMDDGFEAMDLAVIVIVSSLERKFPEVTIEFVEENLLTTEIKGIQTAMYDTLRESGLLQEATPPGEDKSPATKKSSTGTGTQ